MKNPMHRVPARTAATAHRVIDGEAVVVEPKQGMVNVLNAVATRIWELVDGRRDVAAIARCVCDEYDADYDLVSGHAFDFLDSLREKGWITFDERESV